MSGDGAIVFEHACKLGLEGIVSKRKDSRYSRVGHSTASRAKTPRRREAGSHRGLEQMVEKGQAFESVTVGQYA
jgi:hypothetical protein